ncbi:hypothetical protein EBB07_19585 [Paenibacillaceae bacterium]|nr:hypothetical protein EBB07_19585 [Paenibacillaceae bacterium]
MDNVIQHTNYNGKMMLHFEQLLKVTGDLLYRVRIYDRDLNHADEILQMDDTHLIIAQSKWMTHHDVWLETAISKLGHMKHRLLTMMEDLLYTA